MNSPLTRLIAFLSLSWTLTACFQVPNGVVPTPDLDSIHSKKWDDPFKPLKGTCDAHKDMIQRDRVQTTLDPQVVIIKRVFQHTIRKDCKGSTKSDSVETVTSPTAYIHLTNPTRRDFKGVFFFNATTCANKVESMPQAGTWMFQVFPVTGDGHDEVTVLADLSEALFTEHFNSGLNYIYLRFYHDCSPNSALPSDSYNNATCPKSQDFTTVEYPIDIHYSEETLPDTRTVQASCP